jgi:hypothetical protein
VNIRIGMIYSPKELEIELADDTDAEKIAKEIATAIGEDAGMFWLTDRKGRRVGVAAGKVAYVELGPESESRRVGFSGP